MDWPPSMSYSMATSLIRWMEKLSSWEMSPPSKVNVIHSASGQQPKCHLFADWVLFLFEMPEMEMKSCSWSGSFTRISMPSVATIKTTFKWFTLVSYISGLSSWNAQPLPTGCFYNHKSTGFSFREHGERYYSHFNLFKLSRNLHLTIT